MVGITANDYLGSVANIRAMLAEGMGTIVRPITWITIIARLKSDISTLVPLIVAVFCI
jgi:hypothetical protein